MGDRPHLRDRHTGVTLGRESDGGRILVATAAWWSGAEKELRRAPNLQKLPTPFEELGGREWPPARRSGTRPAAPQEILTGEEAVLGRSTRREGENVGVGATGSASFAAGREERRLGGCR
jgi:hypothetical protein